MKGERPANIYSEEALKKLEWERLDKDLPGWYIYYFRSTVAKFHRDTRAAHTGQRSVSIAATQAYHDVK